VSNETNQEKDKWELALDEKLKELKECQERMGHKSCFDCIKLLECNLRKIYVNAVYESMNKGSGGGFEF